MFFQCKDLYIMLNIKAKTIVRTMHNLTPHLVQSGFQVLKTETLNLKSMQFLPHQVLFGHQMIEANNLLRRNKDVALIPHENTIDLYYVQCNFISFLTLSSLYSKVRRV